MNTTELILSLISMVGGSIILGVSGAFVWFKSSKARIYTRLEQLEEDMILNANKHTSWHIENTKKLHGLEIHHEHTEGALTELKGLAQSTLRSLERLLEALVLAKSRRNGDGD